MDVSAHNIELAGIWCNDDTADLEIVCEPCSAATPNHRGDRYAVIYDGGRLSWAEASRLVADHLADPPLTTRSDTPPA